MSSIIWRVIQQKYVFNWNEKKKSNCRFQAFNACTKLAFRCNRKLSNIPVRCPIRVRIQAYLIFYSCILDIYCLLRIQLIAIMKWNRTNLLCKFAECVRWNFVLNISIKLNIFPCVSGVDSCKFKSIILLTKQ